MRTLFYALGIFVALQLPLQPEAIVEDEPFCHVEIVRLHVGDPIAQLALSVSGTDTIIHETQCWTDHGKLPPGHWTHFQAGTWCPPDYSGMCDGRYTCRDPGLGADDVS